MSNSSSSNNTLINWVLLICIVGVAAISFYMANTSDAPEGEAFGGTDAAVTEVLEENGVEPWFNPVLELNSGELESGIFAVQAALGAGIFGFMIGNLRGRTVQRREHDRTDKTN